MIKVCLSRATRSARAKMIVVGSLVTQRNAIRMLYDRIAVLLSYVQAVSQGECSSPSAMISLGLSNLVRAL